MKKLIISIIIFIVFFLIMQIFRIGFIPSSIPLLTIKVVDKNTGNPISNINCLHVVDSFWTPGGIFANIFMELGRMCVKTVKQQYTNNNGVVFFKRNIYLNAFNEKMDLEYFLINIDHEKWIKDKNGKNAYAHIPGIHLGRYIFVNQKYSGAFIYRTGLQREFWLDKDTAKSWKQMNQPVEFIHIEETRKKGESQQIIVELETLPPPAQH